ncbi:MAG TPA: aldehyde dehydrogenase family protein, partial [Acidobacteriota bacterium]
MWRIPVLRAGRPYESLERVILKDFRNGEPVAQVSQANPGLIAKDLHDADQKQHILQRHSIAELIGICKRAAFHFLHSDLPLGDHTQSPEEHVKCLSATTGMPEALCRKNMLKIHSVLQNMESVLNGLTRSLDLSVLDSGWASQSDHPISYLRETDMLGAVLPNNSPGVHSLWLPAVALKVPLALKPGREEPWTPLRIAEAFLVSGCPPQSFGFYPTDYSGATQILLKCGRSMLFGDESTVKPWKQDPRIQVHGPGWSKILIGEDKIADWQNYLDLITTSVVENAGRSCINASGVWVTSHGREIAEALAARLAKIEARSMEDSQAQLAAFTNPKVAARMNDWIESRLRREGALDLTAEIRGPRLVQKDGASFLLPTVLWCEDPDHPLANTEFLFPFVSVVQVAKQELLKKIGHTLVVTAITED